MCVRLSHDFITATLATAIFTKSLEVSVSILLVDYQR